MLARYEPASYPPPRVIHGMQEARGSSSLSFTAGQQHNSEHEISDFRRSED
jgi:hypothetical protein